MTRRDLLKQIIIWEHGAEPTGAQVKRVVDARRGKTDEELRAEYQDIQYMRMRQAALLDDEAIWS